jgi:hypothetical protein
MGGGSMPQIRNASQFDLQAHRHAYPGGRRTSVRNTMPMRTPGSGVPDELGAFFAESLRVTL